MYISTEYGQYKIAVNLGSVKQGRVVVVILTTNILMDDEDTGHPSLECEFRGNLMIPLNQVIEFLDRIDPSTVHVSSVAGLRIEDAAILRKIRRKYRR